MKRYSSCVDEHVHVVKCVPRSYDMSRTHIIHKGVNRRVDVILRCAPKKWKKKKVRVTVVKSGKKKEYMRIRVNARKGYIAVKKAVNHAYDAERNNIAAFDEKNVVRYDKVKAANRALIHDMKSQVAVMAKKSADYIEDQLSTSAAQSEDVTTVLTPPVPPCDASKSAPESAAPQTAVQPSIAQPTVKPSFKANSYNPYAADYSKHFSDAEFHSLMDSLEKSLDEACRKQGIGFEQPASVNREFVKSSVSGYPCNDDAHVSANSDSSFRSWNPGSQPAAEEYKPVTMFPKDEEEEYKPVNMFPKDEEEEYRPVPMFPKDEEEEYKPVTIFPKDEEEEYKPVTMFPKDEEEEYKPVTMFPKDEEEQFTPVSEFPQQNPSEMYNQPQTFAPPQMDYSQPEVSGSVDFDDGHERQTFFSRTGDQIKKVIGIIRGKTSKKQDDDYINENVEITYSDDDNDTYRN